MIYTTAKLDFHTRVMSDVAFALTATDYKDAPTLFVGGGTDCMDEKKGGDGMMDVSATNTAVRRLTPL